MTEPKLYGIARADGTIDQTPLGLFYDLPFARANAGSDGTPVEVEIVRKGERDHVINLLDAALALVDQGIAPVNTLRTIAAYLKAGREIGEDRG